jgi:hypothetical protein
MPPPGGGFSPHRGPGGMGTPGGGVAYGSPGRAPGSIKYVNEAMCGIGIFIGERPSMGSMPCSRCVARPILLLSHAGALLGLLQEPERCCRLLHHFSLSSF